ncbi:MAG: hypothetical protein K9J13_06095 [Saprospiraceae bacterium]|nr:hypothetical protein [Saprospiraceae bacterium]
MSKYPPTEGILAHETVHILKENKTIVVDVPVAAALGYYTSYMMNENLLDENIISIINTTLSENNFLEVLDSSFVNEEIKNNINNILNMYDSQSNETSESYLDGGRLAGEVIRLFDSNYNKGVRFIMSLGFGCDVKLAYIAGTDSLKYNSIWLLKRKKMIELREFLIKDSSNIEFIHDYSKRYIENKWDIDTAFNNSLVDFAKRKSNEIDRAKIDYRGSYTQIVGKRLQGSHLWDKNYTRDYYINTSPFPLSSTNIDPLMITECSKIIFNHLTKLLGDKYIANLSIGEFERNQLVEGKIMIEWTNAIEFNAMTSIIVDSNYIKGALIRIHPSTNQLGYITQELFHTEGAMNNVWDPKFKNVTICFNPLPKVDSIWSKEAINSLLILKYFYLIETLINNGAIKTARSQLDIAEKYNRKTFSDELTLTKYWIRANEPNRALPHAKAAFHINKDDEYAQKHYLFVLNELKMFSEVDSLIDFLKVRDKDDVELKLEIVRMYILNENYTKAEETVESLLKVKPDDPRNYISMAQLRLHDNDTNSVIFYLNKAKNHYKDGGWRIPYGIGMLYVSLNDIDSAQKWLNIAISKERSVMERLHRLQLIK